jgi:hypothetical protein
MRGEKKGASAFGSTSVGVVLRDIAQGLDEVSNGRGRCVHAGGRFMAPS